MSKKTERAEKEAIMRGIVDDMQAMMRDCSREEAELCVAVIVMETVGDTEQVMKLYREHKALHPQSLETCGVCGFMDAAYFKLTTGQSITDAKGTVQ